MRVPAAIVLLTAMAAGQAHASSFSTVAPVGESVSSSMLVLEAPDGPTAAAASPTAPFRFISPSVIVYGEPAAADETSAASAPEPAETLPMVIRGGIAGDTIAAPAPAAAPTLALDPNDKGTPAKRKALKRQQEAMRKAAEAAAAAPPPAPAQKLE